jgi:hypothetical protein
MTSSTVPSEVSTDVPSPPAPYHDLGAGMGDDVAELVAGGRLLEAVRVLSARVDEVPNPKIERRLVNLRHMAFYERPAEPGRSSWPPVVPDLFADGDGLPEVTPGRLDAERLASGITHHGCLLVRGLVPRGRAEALARDVDDVFEAADRKTPDVPVSETLPWYAPLRVPPENEGPYPLHLDRPWAREGGGVYAADSPRGLRHLISTFDDVGLLDLLTQYFGERPALSVKKCTFRKVPVDSDHNWHQDGAFLGSVRAVNAWVALSPCGVDAPSLDIVGRRLDRLAETGTRGAVFKWSVGPEVVQEVADGAPIVRPVFDVGDVLLFDEYNLHRTGVSADMTRPRHAIESWFFAPSAFPLEQIPLAL